MFAQSALVSETGRLQKFAMQLAKNKPDADDLVQATCLRALEKADSFEDGTNLFGWTSKIMFNFFVTGYRRKSKFETQFDPQIYFDKQSVAPTQDVFAELADVKRAMKKISASHRNIIMMICAQGMSYEEVAEQLQIPVGTVRSRLSRARKCLQVALDSPAGIENKTQADIKPDLSAISHPLIESASFSKDKRGNTLVIQSKFNGKTGQSRQEDLETLLLDLEHLIGQKEGRSEYLDFVDIRINSLNRGPGALIN